jgi:hypothetical protein
LTQHIKDGSKHGPRRITDGGKQTCSFAALWFYIGTTHIIIREELIARAYPLNFGIKSLRATLSDEIFYCGFYFLNRAFC